MEAKKINIKLLVEHPDNNSLLPPLSRDEEAELRSSLTEGIRPNPWEVLKDHENYLVLDGNTRLRILREIGYQGELLCTILGDAKDWPIEKQRTFIQRVNLARRNLSREQEQEIAR